MAAPGATIRVWFAARWKASSSTRWVAAPGVSPGGAANPAAENAVVDEPGPAEEPDVGKAAPTLVGAAAGGTPPAAGSPGAWRPGIRSSAYCDDGGWAGQLPGW